MAYVGFRPYKDTACDSTAATQPTRNRGIDTGHTRQNAFGVSRDTVISDQSLYGKTA